MLTTQTGRTAAIIGVEGSALVALHRLGSYGAQPVPWGDLGRWMAETPPEDVLVAAVWVVALALAWWLMATTLLYSLARAARLPRLARGVRWATIPAVRRIIDGALVGSIVAGTTFAPASIALARSDPRDPVVVAADQSKTAAGPIYRPRPAERLGAIPYRPWPAGEPSKLESKGLSDVAVPPASPSAAAPGPATYRVQPGDSFWRIAEREVRRGSPRPVGRYWVRLIEFNRAQLVSGDPNRIFPGEVFDLPGRE